LSQLKKFSLKIELWDASHELDFLKLIELMDSLIYYISILCQ
uniref:C2 domain-containing protein n=1 Tax=Brugia timori TaxID=42155 RepID=A0A0R3Q478_9BILA